MHSVWNFTQEVRSDDHIWYLNIIFHSCIDRSDIVGMTEMQPFIVQTDERCGRYSKKALRFKVKVLISKPFGFEVFISVKSCSPFNYNL